MFPENQWLVQMYVFPIVSIVPFWGDMLFLGGGKKKDFSASSRVGKGKLFGPPLGAG